MEDTQELFTSLKNFKKGSFAYFTQELDRVSLLNFRELVQSLLRDGKMYV